jgi:hypothetical protein
MSWGVDPNSLLLPEGTRLVHIGPPKTGTTAVQGAFHAARKAARAQGVRYAGNVRHSAGAVLAVTGRPSFFQTSKPPDMRMWNSLVRSIRNARQPRVVLSSEFFADAKPDVIPRIVDDLDRSRIHIVVTLRPLVRILPSQWQQYIQSGARAAYGDWLDAMFNRPATAQTPSFWRRHRHDELIRRWAEVVGPERMTVIALDESDHDMVLRVFERLTGLSEGTLVAMPDVMNRSMTWPEIEAVRAFNVSFKAERLSNDVLSQVMRFGAALYMKTREPEPDEPRILTPAWAVERATAVAREIVDGISASGVRVVGDLERLAGPPGAGSTGDPPARICLPPSAVGLAHSPAPRSEQYELETGEEPLPPVVLPPRAEPAELFRVPTGQLARVLMWRVRGRLRRSAWKLLRRNR